MGALELRIVKWTSAAMVAVTLGMLGTLFGWLAFILGAFLGFGLAVFLAVVMVEEDRSEFDGVR